MIVKRGTPIIRPPHMEEAAVERMITAIREVARFVEPAYDNDKAVRRAVYRALMEADAYNKVFGMPHSLVADHLSRELGNGLGYAEIVSGVTTPRSQYETIPWYMLVLAGIEAAVDPTSDNAQYIMWAKSSRG